MQKVTPFNMLKIIALWIIVFSFFLFFMVVFNRYSPYWIERIEFRDPYLHLQEGRKLLEEGNLSGARRQFQYAIQFDGEMGWAYFYIGDIYDRTDQEEEAMRYYYIAMQVEPDTPNFPYRIANKYYQAQDYERAINYFEKTIELNPSEHLLANSLRFLGQAKIKTDDYISGFFYFEKYLEQYPADFHSVLTLADYYFDYGLYEKAREYYQKYLEQDPDNEKIMIQLDRVNEFIGLQKEDSVQE